MKLQDDLSNVEEFEKGMSDELSTMWKKFQEDEDPDYIKLNWWLREFVSLGLTFDYGLSGDIYDVEYNISRYRFLGEQLNALETEILMYLEDEIKHSPIESKHISNCKAIEVNVFDYVELVYWSDRLYFLDGNGNHYDLFSECTLTDLIDILNKI